MHGGVTFVQTELDDDWRPPAAVCISTEHEWRLAGSAFKEQVGLPDMRHRAQALRPMTTMQLEPAGLIQVDHAARFTWHLLAAFGINSGILAATG